MPLVPVSQSDYINKKRMKNIYANYSIIEAARKEGIVILTSTNNISSTDLIQALAQGPTQFTPAELAAVVDNNLPSTVPDVPDGPPVIPQIPTIDNIIKVNTDTVDIIINPNSLPGDPAIVLYYVYVLIASSGQQLPVYTLSFNPSSIYSISSCRI
jgi:hypothetical protein